MTPTEEFIASLTGLGTHDLFLLRTHARQRPDASVGVFHLFKGLRGEWIPGREIAWLIAKVYAYCPISHKPGATLPRQLGHCRPSRQEAQKRFTERFDRMLLLPFDQVEPQIRWALRRLAARGFALDWVKLTRDLSLWEREATRRDWAKEFIGTEKNHERGTSC